MQLRGRATVLGASFFTGDIDGTMMNSGTLYTQVDLDPKHNGKGMRTEPKRVKDSETVKKVMHMPFPFEADLVLEEVATKGKISQVVVEIVPVQLQKPSKAA